MKSGNTSKLQCCCARVQILGIDPFTIQGLGSGSLPVVIVSSRGFSGASGEHRDPREPVNRLRKIQCISLKTWYALRRWLPIFSNSTCFVTFFARRIGRSALFSATSPGQNGLGQTYPIPTSPAVLIDSAPYVSQVPHAPQRRQGTPLLVAHGKTPRRRRSILDRPLLYLGEINDAQQAAWTRTIAAFDPVTQLPQTLALFPDDRPLPVDARETSVLSGRQVAADAPSTPNASFMAGKSPDKISWRNMSRSYQ